MTVRPLSCALMIAAAAVGACSSAVPTGDPGVSAVGNHVRLYEGPELEVALGTGYAAGHLGEDILVLGASLAGSSGSRPVKVHRDDVLVRTPDRRTIQLMTQEEFRTLYGSLSAAVRHAEAFSPTLLDYGGNRRPSSQWFLVAPTEGVARDELVLTAFDVCDGVLLFRVPGGIQPGRWELEIGLEESTAEIPFVLE